MAIVWALLFVLAILIAWCTNVLGLPGNWLMVALAVLYWILKPADTGATLSTTVLIVMAVLAALGELLEILMSAATISKAGGGRQSAWYCDIRFNRGRYCGPIYRRAFAHSWANCRLTPVWQSGRDGRRGSQRNCIRPNVGTVLPDR